MSLRDEIAADFRNIHRELPAYIELGGQRIPAMVSDCRDSEDLLNGGFSAVRGIEVRVVDEDLPTLPEPGDSLHYEGKAYRISSVQVRKHLPIVSIECQQV